MNQYVKVTATWTRGIPPEYKNASHKATENNARELVLGWWVGFGYF